MKHFLRTLFLLTLVGFSYLVNAQRTSSCGATDLLVQNIERVGTTGCTYRFDVSFSLTGNPSIKYVFLQTYLQGAYNDYFQCDQTTNTSDVKKPPVAADFDVQPLLNVAIDLSGPTPEFTNYTPDPSVLIRGVVDNESAVDTFEINGGKDIRYVITDLEVTIPNCTAPTPQIFITDIFTTNNPGAQNLHCVSCGLRFAAGFFNAQTPFIGCNAYPLRQYSATLTNNTDQPITGTYTVYADINMNGFLTTEGIDVEITPTPIPFEIPGGGQTTLSGVIPEAYFGMNIFLLLDINNAGGVPIDALNVIFLPAIECAATPVKMKSFTATRKNQNVELVWETATEDNNRGFYVQRNNGDGWKDLSFVASKASDGNSISDLSYNYTDLNNTSRGVTQYRIMQVDIDGKSKMSEVRQVRGLAQAGKVTVYPNPSSTGKVNVVFEDGKTTWNVSVADMNGRTIKQYKGVTNNVLVDNLLPGMYMIRIVDAQTGDQTNEKVIINNR